MYIFVSIIFTINHTSLNFVQ